MRDGIGEGAAGERGSFTIVGGSVFGVRVLDGNTPYGHKVLEFWSSRWKEPLAEGWDMLGERADTSIRPYNVGLGLG
jgi:hypothetical protein